MKKFALFILALLTAVVALGQTQALALKRGTTYIWDGKLGFVEGVDFSVRSQIHVTDRLVVPEGCTLYIRGDGTLVVDKGAQMIIKGQVKINNGGVIRNFGTVTVERRGVINNYGWFINRENASFTNTGDFNIFKTGRCNNYGSFSSHSGSDVYVTGHLYIRDKGVLDMAGKMRIRPGGFVRCYNRLNVNSAGIIKNGGRLDVTDTGLLNLLGGRLNVEENASLTGAGFMQLTRFLAFTCQGTATLRVNPPQVRQVNGVYYVGEVMLCNKKYPLPENFGDGIDNNAYEALEQMRADSGDTMNIVSGYRSYDYQSQTFAYWESLYGTDAAERVSARAGTSEHQTGQAFDITSLEQTYGNSAEGIWLAENCWKYGFVIRFPENCEEHTGYTYEPWHIRYVGKEIAARIHEQGGCLEEFLGLA